MARPTEVPGLSPETPLSLAGPLLVRARLADVRRHEEKLLVRGEPDPDVVHDMRVAARRLRAAIVLFGGKRLRALDEEVEALQDALGEVRDLQLQRRWFAERGDDGGGDDARALAAWAAEPLPGALERLEAALRAWTAEVAARVEAEARGAGGKGRLGGKRLARRIRAGLEELEERVARAGNRPRPRAAHRLRIAAKRTRYLAELLHAARPEAVDRAIDALAGLQDRLGELHDTDVRVDRLERLAADRNATARDAAQALLPGVRAHRVAQARRLGRELERWRAERVGRRLRAGFRGKARVRRGPARLDREPAATGQDG